MGGNSNTSMVEATFFLITYNQEKYVREALEGAFNQIYSPLEIVISDDCSSDGTFWIIEEMCRNYTGPHKVVVNRNDKNLGLIGHINMIDSLSSGELIVYAAGDDISLPNRVERVVDRYLATGRMAASIHSSVELIDVTGRKVGIRRPPVVEAVMDMDAMAVCTAMVIGAANAFTRQVRSTFGPIGNPKCIEDLVIGFRSVLTGGLEYIDEPLVLYRHESGITSVPDRRKQSYASKLKREVSEAEMHVAVYWQRLADLRLIGRIDLDDVIERARSKELLRRKILVGKYRFSSLFLYAMKRGLARTLLRAEFRKLKWRIFFPLKGFIFSIKSAK